jgi:PAS domain S-box-containing protein
MNEDNHGRHYKKMGVPEMLEPDRISIEGQSLNSRLRVISALLFFFPCTVTAYLIYSQGQFSTLDSLHLLIFSLLLMLAFAGISVLRQAFEKFVMVSVLMKKVDNGEMTLMDPMKDTTELHEISISFNRLVSRLEEMSGQMETLSRELKEETEGRNRAEESLIALKKAVDIMKLGVTITDACGKITYTNLADARMHGYTVEELIGLDARIFAPREFHKELGYEDIQTMTNWRRDSVNIRKDGTCFPVRVTSDVVMDAEGHGVGVVTTCENITERKRMEEELAKQAHLVALWAQIGVALGRNQDLRDILQHCSELLVQYLEVAFFRIWTLNETEQVLEMQASAGMYTHIDGPHGRVPVGMFKIGMIAFERKPHLTNDVLNDPRIGDREWARREGMIAFAGYPLIVADRLVGVMATFARTTLTEEILGALGSVAGRIAQFIERKRVEEEIRTLNTELELKVEERTRELVETQEKLLQEEKLAMLGRIAGNMGNELRNPLGVMSNAVFLLQTVMPDADETVSEYLGIIGKEIDNSQQIISDLTDFCRVSSPRTEPVAVHELIRQSREQCMSFKNIRFQADLPETLPKIQVDQLQIEQVLRHLIANAVQAMPEGGVLRVAARRVRSDESGERSANEIASPLTTHPSQDFVEISVTDSGEGIAPENMEKLFQPLFSTKSRGIGLGLAISKKLTEANGGSIEVENRSGDGTTFTVTLPVWGE